MKKEFTIEQLARVGEDLNRILALKPPINVVFESKAHGSANELSQKIFMETLKAEIVQLVEYQDKETGRFDLQPGDLPLLQPETVEVIKALSPVSAERFASVNVVTSKPKKKRNRIIAALIARAKQEHMDELKERGISKQWNLKRLEAADLKYTVNIPQFVIDQYLSQMSATSWKLFSYICRCVTFDPKHQHFGICRLTHEKIAEITGIKPSNMRRYELELEELGLLRVKVIQKREDGEFRTIHHYEVTFFKIQRDHRHEKDAISRYKNCNRSGYPHPDPLPSRDEGAYGIQTKSPPPLVGED